MGWTLGELYDVDLHRTLNRIIDHIRENLDIEPRSLDLREANKWYLEKLPIIEEMIKTYLQDRIKSWEDKSRFASHLRILIRIVTRELSVDGGIYLTKNIPIKPWGYYLDRMAIIIMEENGVLWDDTQNPNGYYSKLYKELGYDLNELYRRVYESAMTPNPVHGKIDENNLL